MCLILVAHQCHPAYRLVFAANRDEFYDRPAAPAAFWPDAPEILAGRDLVGSGTWLGIARSGRVASIANFRDPSEQRTATCSRGDLVPEFLLDAASAETFLKDVARRANAYRGFNLLVWDGEALAFYSSREDRVRVLEPGIHGVSNGSIDDPWPKVERGKRKLSALLARGGDVAPGELFPILADRTRPPDSLLPDTGVGLARERVLGSAFIVSPGYGTRCSTVVTITREGEVTFVERTFQSGRTEGDRRFRFTLGGEGR